MNTIPYYWRLSAFYFFFFASIGALMPYWSLYLQTIGFNAIAIGELTAIIFLTKIIAPNLWGWIGDRTGRHIGLVRIGSLLTAICFLGIFVAENHYLWLALIIALSSFFQNATLPQFEAITLAHLGKQAQYYSNIRLWGSVGFIITVAFLGWLFQYISVTNLPLLVVILFISVWLTSLSVPEKVSEKESIVAKPFLQILKKPRVIALFFICFLMQASHGPYYTFYSIYLENQGYTRSLIGQLWALGVIAEVGAFLIMYRLLADFRLSSLLMFSVGITGIRWLLIGYYVESLPILLFAQLIHAASFGMYHGVAMQSIRQIFPNSQQGKAQALYSSLSFGAGGAVGSLVSGYTWEHAGAQITHVWAALLCFIAVWICWQWVGRAGKR